MFARTKEIRSLMALALLSLPAQVALAGGPPISQTTRAGTIQIIKGETSAEFKLGNQLLYRYTQGFCTGIQWHGFAGQDELTLVYASTCGNGVNPTWRLIVVKPDKRFVMTEPFGDVPDVQVTQLGDQVTFSYKKTIAGIYQRGQLTRAGKPVAFSAIPAIE